MQEYFVTEFNRFIMRKNEEFSIIDAVLNYAIKKAEEESNDA